MTTLRISVKKVLQKTKAERKKDGGKCTEHNMRHLYQRNKLEVEGM
jgi:hypothetical protein